LQCPDKDELAAVMKLLEEHRGDFWPDFIAVTLMAGARRGALCLRVRASGLRGGAVREARLAGMFDDTPPTGPGPHSKALRRRFGSGGCAASCLSPLGSSLCSPGYYSFSASRRRRETEIVLNSWARSQQHPPAIDCRTWVSALTSGLSFPFGIAVSGFDLFVTNFALPGAIGEYTTSACVMLCLPGVPQRQRRLRHEPVCS
jgi:hypothetical protein